MLQHDLARTPRREQPICIYFHIPFCDAKCGFCDSYSFKLGGRRAQHVAAYSEMLCGEMALWCRQGDLRTRPVSTVHFGGGTPTFLDATELARIVDTCARTFAVTDKTEWALESTAAGMAPPMLASLHTWGFRRLHVGVQSMEDAVRTAIGRRSTATYVKHTIEAALALGWIVSVDLICGLPGQTFAGFLAGISTLAELGVEGVSLYELLIYPQNRHWADQHLLTSRSHLPNYVFFCAGSQLLEQLGYRKNLFNHWAKGRDDNRYFTFPARGEDLLAMGTIADGVFGDYHYRHPRDQGYRQSQAADFPALEGGLRRTAWEDKVWPLMTALLSGCMPATLPAAVLGEAGDQLVLDWVENGLLTPADGSYMLSSSGSWFVGNMMRMLTPPPAGTPRSAG